MSAEWGFTMSDLSAFTEQEQWEIGEVERWLLNEPVLYERFQFALSTVSKIGLNKATNKLVGLLPAVGHLGVPFKWIYLRMILKDHSK